MIDKKWYIYMLLCNDNTTYFGITTDLKRREKEHNGLDIKLGSKAKSRGAKYTRARRPVEIVYSEVSENRQTASIREAELKKLKRVARLKLIVV